MRTALAVVIVTLGVLLAAPPARAQAPGNIVLTAEAMPEKLTGPARTQHLRKKGLRTLPVATPSTAVEVHAYARLKVVPRQKTLDLPQNGGKLKLFLVKRPRKRFVLEKLADLDYTPGSLRIDFPVKLEASHGLKPGVTYRLRVVIESAQKLPVILAQTVFTVSDGSEPRPPARRAGPRRRAPPPPP
jgi:hypothetical protein